MHQQPSPINSDRAQPRVLLVDDHRGILDSAAAVLTGFDVVGMATDGGAAIEMARQLAPDVIVLDIHMPGINGFQTKRALEQSGSRAPVVFLSAEDTDACVSEAFQCGARGFVAKTHLVRDLAYALDQVVHRRLFAPSLRSLHQATAAGGHAIHVHSDEKSFAASIASCFDAALLRGDATCLIGTAALRHRVARQLRVRGWEVTSPGAERRYRALDTHTALAYLLRDGMPDAARLAAMVDELDEYRRTVCVGRSSRLTIAGELSTAVCAAGTATAALAIERLWNTQTQGRPFFTVCGYAVASFRGHARELRSLTTAEHSAVCHAPDW